MSDTMYAGPGAFLRQQRESRGLSVADVALAIKLSPRQVYALEADDFDALRGPTYVRGFVRNYARHLQIDAAPLIDMIDARVAAAEVDLAPISNAAGAMPVRGGTGQVPRPLIAVTAVLVAVLAVVVYLDRARQDAPGAAGTAVAGVAPAARPAAATPPVPAAPPEPPAAPSSMAPALPSAIAAAPPAEAAPPAASAATPAPAAAPAPVVLTFRFSGRSWVEVRDREGKAILSRVHDAGGETTVDGLPPFAVVIGNAAAVQLAYQGKSVDLAPHTKESVARLRLE